jgi:hypothetical protein
LADDICLEDDGNIIGDAGQSAFDGVNAKPGEAGELVVTVELVTRCSGS